MHSERYSHDDLGFLVGLGAVGLVTLAFIAQLNGAAFVMSAICFAALVGARIVGIPGYILLPLGLGLALLTWMVWNYPPGGPEKTSAVAHFWGGALSGWALAATLRRRFSGPWWWMLALAGTAMIAGVWELAEWAGDRALDTGLVPSRRDSAFDFAHGILGAIPGIWVARFARGRDSVAARD